MRERASNLLVKFARKEWPRIIAAVDVIASVDGIADNLADRLARALVQELREVLSQPDHPVRQDYEAGCRTISDGCAAIRRWRRRPNAQAARHRSSEGAGVRARTMGRHPRGAAADLSTPDSALAASGKRLAGDGPQARGDAALREALNRHVLGAARRLTGRLRAGVTGHIARTVKNWDERHLVDELELSVGRDLQYIRFNGTLVGG